MIFALYFYELNKWGDKMKYTKRPYDRKTMIFKANYILCTAMQDYTALKEVLLEAVADGIIYPEKTTTDSII